MESNNTEEVKKVRKPRLPKLQRKFINLQNQVAEIQEEVNSTIQKLSKVPPQNIDFSHYTIGELTEIQIRLSTLISQKAE